MKVLVTTIVYMSYSMVVCSQTKEEPIWWQWERDGNYLEVASHLLYQVHTDTTRSKHADYLHIGRMYGYLNDYEKASFYWKKAMEDETDPADDQFLWYYQGTLAFFERDKERLFKYMRLLEKNHSAYYTKNAKILKSLYDKFEKGYLEACNWK